MAKFDVNLPEISVETFEHAWLRFELAASGVGTSGHGRYTFLWIFFFIITIAMS